MLTQTLERIVAGTSAPARSSFVVPSEIDPTLGSITWDILDNEGIVYSSGATTGYTTTVKDNDTLVTADATIVVPSTIPVNVVNSKYQLRWKLQVGSSIFFNFETFTVLPVTPQEQGAVPLVELSGKIASPSIVLPDAYTEVGFEVYLNNDLLLPLTSVVASEVNVAEGYSYSGQIDTSVLRSGQDPASMVPYQVMWIYNNAGKPPNYEGSRLYVVTPSILMAANDVRDMINRAHSTINGAPDLTFTIEDLLTYLRMGMDQFNGFANATNFTMLNATGPVRYFWIAWSQIQALRSQYLAEGDKAFNFSGQSVSLDSDRTAYYEGLASAIESRITEDCRQLKLLLSKRGVTAGDGNVNPLALKFGAIGSIGISMSPVSNLRLYGMTWPFNRR
jgi:hypothetical protein